MSKKQDPQVEDIIKKEDLKPELESVVTQYNKAIQDRAAADELAKRCLGAIEVLQGLIGEETSEKEEEAEIVE
tara:strand:- start:56 stop:274 length:219 start_codon:yes stop_codon:yes gene_type:complete